MRARLLLNVLSCSRNEEFYNSKDELSYVRGGVVDDRETQMMKVRWRVFNLFFQIPEEQQKSVPPCAKCFSRLIFPQDD